MNEKIRDSVSTTREFSNVRVPCVGLTGGIASGKSTVSSFFAKLGVPVLDADQLAREVVQPGTVGARRILDLFGAAYFDETGVLNRQKLAQHVFHDKAARGLLEQAIHPLIEDRRLQWLSSLTRAVPQPQYAIYEASLLVETRSYLRLEALIVVVVSPSTQFERLTLHRGLSAQDARARLMTQASTAEKRALADYELLNEGAIDKLESQVIQLHHLLMKRFEQSCVES